MSDLTRSAPALPALPLWRILGDEGFRLFFPLCVLHGALWPFLWVAIDGLAMPLSGRVAPGIWHAHEMIVGCYGAALIGFLTTAVPEWTDTEPLRGRPLYALAAFWGVGRCVGLLGWDAAIGLAALADLAWMAALLAYIAGLSLRRRTDRLLAFMLWIALLIAAEMAARWGMLRGNADLAATGAYAAGFVFLGFLGIALARVTVPVTNLVLDPSEETSPFRPHPGRLNLSAGLVFVALAGEAFGLSDAVRGYLWIAAGAGFLDRVAENFVGRRFFRLEILGLALSAGFAGVGLMLIGASLLDAPIGPTAGLHMALMGGLGIGVLQVLSVAGLIHAGHSLPFPRGLRFAFLLIILAVLLRAGPDLGLFDHPFGAPYLASSLLWSAGLLVWLRLYRGYIGDAEHLRARGC
ncbi:NnrS family protein [Tropicimonas sp.]|uniref:NnrS family protein n=1 Tax=Tropicimonas sp. TaxID=2067044 RepID=UPI003A8BCB58